MLIDRENRIDNHIDMSSSDYSHGLILDRASQNFPLHEPYFYLHVSSFTFIDREHACSRFDCPIESIGEILRRDVIPSLEGGT